MINDPANNFCIRKVSMKKARVFLISCAALALTFIPKVSAQPLPEGDSGIAARWPGDAGIASDPAVIFADDFESYGSSAGLTTKWTQAYPATNLRIATELGNFFGGNKALEFTVPRLDGEVNATVIKQLNPERDVLFLRYYARFDEGYNVLGSSHNGSSISSHYCCPGERADGYNKFLVNFETERFETTLANPGRLGVYIYHPDQRDVWGDIFFPTGVVSPFTSVPFDFGPGFVARPYVIPQLGRWYCYEIMVKVNTPGQRDARIALWLDGNLIADFQNLRLRETTALKIDKFGLALYIHGNTLAMAREWFDNVVAATAYIGPMLSTQRPVVALAGSPTNGQFGFSFQTVNGQSYSIQQNTNLAIPNWVTATSFLGTGLPCHFATPATNTRTPMFFRVREP
jgi:hypothetical protein